MTKMSKVILLISTILFLSGIGLQAANGFYINSGKLYDANGSEFIIRGISHAHTWYTDKSTQAIPEIKAAGANTVRLVLSNGKRWTKTSSGDLSNLITLCKNNKLITIPEIHDTTGYGEEGAAATLAEAAAYWVEMKSVLTGQEKYVIINIGNEPYGNNNYANWVNATKSAIQTLRNAGFTHTLMVDAPNWGQDWAFTMRDNAQSVFDADTLKNTILSIHMYGVFDTAAEVSSYLSAFKSKNLPLCIGEFGHNHSDGNPDEDAIMSNAQSSGIGYMGWSWCGNSSDVSYLDMVYNWSRNTPTSWGTRFFTGANGLSTTSKVCTVYSGATVAPTPTPTATRTATATVLKGDVNSDNTITIMDALMVAQYAVGMNPPNFDPGRADVNCDSSITIIDALMIAQHSVGLITSFPC